MVFYQQRCTASIALTGFLTGILAVDWHCRETVTDTSPARLTITAPRDTLGHAPLKMTMLFLLLLRQSPIAATITQQPTPRSVLLEEMNAATELVVAENDQLAEQRSLLDARVLRWLGPETMRTPTEYSSQARPETGSPEDLAMFEATERLAQAKAENRALQENIAWIEETLEAKLEHTELPLGGLPWVFDGWENSGSTGYTWSVNISDPTVVGFFETEGKGRDTNSPGVCGGGRDFAYEFHALSPGDATVEIHHGRSWEVEKAVPKKVLRVTVPHPDDRAAAALSEVLSAARLESRELDEQLQALSLLVSADKSDGDGGVPEPLSDHGTTAPTSATANIEGQASAGSSAELFRIRQVIASRKARIRRAEAQLEREAAHTTAMKQVGNEQSQLEAENVALASKRDALKARHATLWEERNSYLEIQLAQQLRVHYEEGYLTSTIDGTKEEIELHEAQQGLEMLKKKGQLLKDEIADIEAELPELTAAVEQLRRQGQ